MSIASALLLTLLVQPASSPFVQETVTEVGSGYRFCEGPAWVGNQFVFCDMRGDTVYSWSGKMGDKPQVLRNPCGNAVGSSPIKGGLVQVELAGRRIIKWNPAKPQEVTTFADNFEGKKLGGMNDLAAHSNGSVYVTHAEWFLRPSDLEFKHSGVLKIDPNGKVSIAVDGIAQPNGICFNPKGNIAYVTEYSSGKILAFDVEKGTGALTKQRIFADLNVYAEKQGIKMRGGADGLRTDRKGNIFSTGPGGIWVLSPKAEFIAHLPVVATNLAIGGKDGKTLLITKRNDVVAINLK